jgi:hypothetical protein
VGLFAVEMRSLESLEKSIAKALTWSGAVFINPLARQYQAESVRLVISIVCLLSRERNNSDWLPVAWRVADDTLGSSPEAYSKAQINHSLRNCSTLGMH